MKYLLPLLLALSFLGAGCSSASDIDAKLDGDLADTVPTASNETVTNPSAGQTSYANRAYQYRITYPTSVDNQPVKRESGDIRSAYATFKQTTALTLAPNVTLTINVYEKNNSYFSDLNGFDRITVDGRPAYQRASANAASSWLIDTLIPGTAYDYGFQYANTSANSKEQRFIDLQNQIVQSLQIGD